MRRALYTILIGKYEHLNPLPDIAQTGIDAYCFSDDPDLHSTGWKVVRVEPAFALDTVRSQRLIKLLGHPVLDAYHETLYIDGSVRLKVNPNDILDSWLAEADLALPEHSFRSTVEDEFAAVIAQKLDSRERVTEQLSHYQKLYAKTLGRPPLWTAIMARRKTPTVEDFSRVWANHILRYSRRDQLSIGVAAEISGVSLTRIPLDNHDSDLHQWPIRGGHKENIRHTDIPDYFEKFEHSQLEVTHYRDLLEKTWTSLSWRLTKPLRFGRRR